MYGLLDCNNFFVSCERVFNPALNNRPVVVLSNNDGCVISRSNEAKKLGIKMGAPYFKIKKVIVENNVAVFSTNFNLYGDMSDRVMSVLAGLVPGMEIYSIDEAFVNLQGINDIEGFSRHIVRTVTKCTGIPVSLGVAPTKTLAKMANHFAKKYKGYKQVCIIDSEEKRIKALKLSPVGDVWGIGRRNLRKLEYYSVQTAYDFTQKNRAWVRRQMSVTGERTWTELRGIPCIGSDDMAEKKQICTSRTFGKTVSDFETLFESVADFAALCAEKLRKQHSSAKAVYVFVQTDRFKDSPYSESKFLPLSFPTSGTGEIIHYCKLALQRIYKDGEIYKRAGVVLTDLIDDCLIQEDLFDPVDRNRQRQLSKSVDRIARKNGRETIRIAAQGRGYRPYTMQNHLSKRYTTNLKEIIEISSG